MLFSVPKIGFRNAVLRNLIRRRIREAYRRRKTALYDFLTGEKICITMIVIFKENSVPDYKSVERSIDEMLKKLISLVSEKEK